MSNRIKNNLKNLVGQTLNQYYSKVKPTISDLRYKQEYQNRIIECMVGEVDDNYITTPETDNPIVKLEHSKEGLVKVPTVKGKTILVDADGNETDTPAEGCRLVSVGEEDNKLIILSKNKNLVNKDMLMIGNLDGNGESTENINGFYLVTKDFINISGIEYISLRRALGTHEYSYHAQISFYDENKNKIGINCYDGATVKQSVPIGASFAKFRVYKDNTNIYFGEYILEQEYKYIEPKQHKTEILLNEPLRSLPNGVCDEIVGNQLIRRVGKIVLDGTQKFSVDFDNINKGRIWIPIANVIKIKANSPDHNCYCDRFSKDDIPNVDCCFVAYKNQVIFLPIIGRFSSEKEIKEWFKSNPTTVLYELAEPTIEELPNGITLQGFDDTTMYIENSITPTVTYGYNALIPYKNELSQQKEEVETNTLDIENNIIPYLMDMEFNLMTMEDNE